MLSTPYVNAAAVSSSSQPAVKNDFKRIGFNAAPFDKAAHPVRGGGFFANDELAKLLGVTADELGQSLRSGKTLAQLAADKGVDVQAVTDAIVKSWKAKLDQQLADGKLTKEQYDQKVSELNDHVAKLINGELPPKGGHEGSGHAGKGGPGGHGFSRGFAASEELTSLLGVTADELKEALLSGKTLASIATEKGKDVQTVIDVIVKAETARLDEALASGKLTQEQRDEWVNKLQERVSKQVNEGFGGKFHHGQRSERGSKSGNGSSKAGSDTSKGDKTAKAQFLNRSASADA